MKKTFVLAALLVPMISALCVSPAGAAMAASTSTVVVWPEYQAKPWVLGRQVPMGTLVQYSPKNNDYTLSPGKFEVRVGTVSWYFDNADLNNAELAVAELSILGNGPVFRRLMTREISDVDSQVLVKGKWVSLPPRSELILKVADEEAVITKNQMSSVTMTIVGPSGKVLLEMKLENKEKKK